MWPVGKVVVGLLLLSILACHQENAVKDEEPHERGILDPATARKVLIVYLQEKIKGSISHPDHELIEDALSSREQIESLRKDEGVLEGRNCYFASGWAYNQHTLLLAKMVGIQGGHKYDIQGRFKKNNKSEWEVVITGVSHLNTGP